MIFWEFEGLIFFWNAGLLASGPNLWIYLQVGIRKTKATTLNSPPKWNSTLFVLFYPHPSLGFYMLVLRFCKIPTPGVSTDMIPWFHLQTSTRNFTILAEDCRPSWWHCGLCLGAQLPVLCLLFEGPRCLMGFTRGNFRWSKMMTHVTDVCFEGDPTLGFGGWKDSHYENGLKNKLVNRNYPPWN